MLSDFPWRPAEFALENDQSFEPILESYSKGHRGSEGYYYFVLARWGEAGYMARYRQRRTDESGDFRECIISLKDLDELQKILSHLSIRLGYTMSCFDGAYGLIRVSNSSGNSIDIAFSDMEQPGWEGLTDFRNELSACLGEKPKVYDDSQSLF